MSCYKKRIVSGLTYRVVASFEDMPVNTSDCINWAIEMLELGYETPHLLMLAGCNKSESYFDIKPYVEASVKELGLEMKPGEEGVISYAYYLIKTISLNRNVRQNLGELYRFCQQREYEDVVYDFYLLWWAWDQIDYDDTNANHYWEGVTGKTIEKTVVKVANDWLKKFKEHNILQHVRVDYNRFYINKDNSLEK